MGEREGNSQVPCGHQRYGKVCTSSCVFAIIEWLMQNEKSKSFGWFDSVKTMSRIIYQILTGWETMNVISSVKHK
jgi:hypothetical protein